MNSSQGWEEEKTQGWIIAKGGKKRKPRAVIKTKGGNSNNSPNNHPGGCIQQVRVHTNRRHNIMTLMSIDSTLQYLRFLGCIALLQNSWSLIEVNAGKMVGQLEKLVKLNTRVSVKVVLHYI